MATEHDGVTTIVDRNIAQATAMVDASPAEIFDFLRRPANHATISGDETVRDSISGPELLEADSRFGMKMRLGVPYRIRSRVFEFDENRRIAWAHVAGHRWRWELQPDGGKTRVTETFDLSTARFPPALRLAGYPGRHEGNVARSVANVRDHFAAG